MKVIFSQASINAFNCYHGISYSYPHSHKWDRDWIIDVWGTIQSLSTYSTPILVMSETGPVAHTCRRQHRSPTGQVAHSNHLNLRWTCYIQPWSFIRPITCSHHLFTIPLLFSSLPPPPPWRHHRTHMVKYRFEAHSRKSAMSLTNQWWVINGW